MALGRELTYDEVKEGQKRILASRRKAIIDRILKRREEEKLSKPKKEYKEDNIMKARSDLKKKGDKYTVDTEMNIKKGLEPKVKRALKKSITEEMDKKIGKGIKGGGPVYSSIKGMVDRRAQRIMDEDLAEELRKEEEDNAISRMTPKEKREYYNKLAEYRNGWRANPPSLQKWLPSTEVKVYPQTGVIMDEPPATETQPATGTNPGSAGLGKGLKKSKKIVLDYSSSEDEKPIKRRGRPKKGKGTEYENEMDSSSDDEDIKTYGQMLNHLIKHIKDPKEPIDPKDYKQAVMLIKKIKAKKA